MYFFVHKSKDKICVTKIKVTFDELYNLKFNFLFFLYNIVNKESMES